MVARQSVIRRPLITRRRPTALEIQNFLQAQNQLELTYDCVGATEGICPTGFCLDQHQLLIGEGEEAFLLATQAFREQSQFAISWAELCLPGHSLREGEPVGVLARSLGFWWLNASRIVRIINFRSTARIQYGFTYGTLPGHMASGEERFMIEHDLVSGRVYFEIKAFSRPQHPLAKLGRFWMRRTQQRFGRMALEAFADRVAQLRTMPSELR